DSGQLALELAGFDPASFLRGLLARLEGVLDIERIRLELPPSPSPAFGDTARLERVVVNLLTNALKYSDPGSTVVLRADTLGGRLVVSVSDSGPGIPADEVPSLFARFRRTSGARARGEGLGLGLYICKRLIEAHHGRIWVHSEVGRGTTVTFEVPALAGVAEAAPQEGAS
ncbi:MAG: sensor histidine kinase, partial [Myxococcaceae bacterium]